MINEYILERDGFAFVVPENHNFKFELLEGQQMLDVAIWSRDYPKREFLSMHQTLALSGTKIYKGSKFWSDYKIRRIIAECVDETEYESSKDGWFHHFLTGYCDDEENNGRGSCKTNILNSIEKFGLGVENLNDNTINLFLKAGPRPGSEYKLRMDKSDAKKGDYVTFKSRIDLIVSVSICPQVDFIRRFHYNIENSKSIKISIYE